MTTQKRSTTKGKKEQKEYFIKGKQKITDQNAPVISDEFIDVQPEGEYRGQTIEVKSETNLEKDLGQGNPYILRTYEFSTSPEFLNNISKGKANWPSAQEIFDSHMNGIAGMLWSDGMAPATELEPRIVFSKNKKKYLIMVWAQPTQVLHEKPMTLGEIVRKQNDSRRHTDSI